MSCTRHNDTPLCVCIRVRISMTHANTSTCSKGAQAHTVPQLRCTLQGPSGPFTIMSCFCYRICFFTCLSIIYIYHITLLGVLADPVRDEEVYCADFGLLRPGIRH